VGRGGRPLSTRKESELAGVGGLRIYWQAWLPDTAPRSVIAIAHGASEHSGRYAHVAARLVADGHAVYAIEHRGHARSEGPPALIDRLANAVADLHCLVLHAAGAHAGIPVFLLGHSMGGTVAVAYALAHQDRLDGLILSGPLAALEAAPPHMRLAGRVLSAIAPRLPLISIDASLISRDPAAVQAYLEDPLVYHGKLPARTVAELARAIDSFPEAVPTITIPTLIMYGTADGLCPPAGSLMLAERIGATDKTLLAYDGLYHEIFNEPEQHRVLDDLCAWLAARTVPVAAADRA
jgi:alpha-beta hydrolase superfamily lysophospholipase